MNFSQLLLSYETLGAATLALLIERLTGYPAGLYRLIRHPAVWIGALIGLADRAMNREGGDERSARRAGALALGLVCAIVLAITVPISLALRMLPFGWVAEAFLSATLLSQCSLLEHVEAVADAAHDSLERGRAALARIVGRDTAQLDESDVARGALESLAESTSDGVTAPLIYMAIAGLPGAALYKAINTADSMIGHRTRRHEHFGFAAARGDDLANLPAARLTGWLYGLAAGLGNAAAGRRALEAMRRDAPKHVSPNAGWPEAALAGALDVRLGGPRLYQGRKVHVETMGEGRDELHTSDIRRGLALYRRVLTLLLAVMLLLVFIPAIFR